MNTNHVIRNAAILSALVLSSIGYRASAALPVQGVDPTTTVTATMDGGIAKTGNTWYELGVNTASNTTGLVTGFINGQADPLSTFLIQPAKGNNVLLLDSANKTGSLTFTRPLPLSGIELAGSSGNGSGTLIPTLHFSDGTSSAYTNKVTLGDWFNTNPRAETSHGRIDFGATSASSLFNNVGAANPAINVGSLTLSTADQAKFVTSIDLSWTGSGTGTHTAVFGVSGDVTGIGHYTAIPLAPSSFNQDVIVGLSEVPEPGTIALFGLGAAGLLACYRRKNS